MLPVAERTLCFTDLETTGLYFLEGAEILEISAAIVTPDTFEIEDHKTWKVKPYHIHTAHPKALEVNHYDPEAWLDAVPLRTALLEWREFVKGKTLVGHNFPGFDWAFLNFCLWRHQLRVKHGFKLDTITAAYDYARRHPEKKITSLRLQDCARFLGVLAPDQEQTHDAEGDVLLNIKVAKALWGRE